MPTPRNLIVTGTAVGIIGIAGLMLLFFNRERVNTNFSVATSPNPIISSNAETKKTVTPRPVPPLPPKSLSELWEKAQEVFPDSALYGLDRLIDLRGLMAYPTAGGNPTVIENLEDLDGLPSTAFTDNPIAVYETSEDWNLVHSRKGWYWILCRQEELLKGRDFDPNMLFVHWEDPGENSDQIVPDSSPSSKGWIVYSRIRKIEPLPDELLHVAPDLGSDNFGGVKRGFLRILAFHGDWVKVQEPIEIGSVPQEKNREEIPLLKVRWDSTRIGWIRWKVPSSVPNRPRMLFRGSSHFGVID